MEGKVQNAINEIISIIPRGRVFDSHYVISQIIKNHSNTYLNFASEITAESDKTLVVHGRIGKEIAKFEGDLVQRIEGMSWSENIHGNSSDCTAWRKL